MNNIKIKTVVLALLLVFLGACSKETASYNGSETGKSGSLARFTIAGNYLYAIDESMIKTYSLTAIQHPVLLHELDLHNNMSVIETIFSIGNSLLVGADNGVHLLQIQPTGIPTYQSFYAHFKACDPVVSDGNFAYITVRSGRNCRIQETVNELQIVNIQNFNNPIKIATVPLTFPQGLGVDRNLLFVSDEGLRIFDITQKNAPKEIQYLRNLDAIDVIPLSGQLLVIGKKTLTQIDYTNQANIRTISTLYLGN